MHRHGDDAAHAHEHGDHDDSHADHSHEHGSRQPRVVRLERDILAKNETIAGHNREFFRDREILAVNLVSSPGSGKTTLLEQTVRMVASRLPVAVIEGDQETELDADRIRRAGCPAVQINTGAGCHLDADMVARGLRQLDPRPRSLLLIENVGNLVCPALFDLGEQAKVVVMSVTEGEDKPLKYPHMFRAARVLVINKIDLLPYVTFDMEWCVTHARTINPKLLVFQTSATRGDGLEQWCEWLLAGVPRPRVMAGLAP